MCEDEANFGVTWQLATNSVTHFLCFVRVNPTNSGDTHTSRTWVSEEVKVRSSGTTVDSWRIEKRGKRRGVWMCVEEEGKKRAFAVTTHTHTHAHT